MANDSDTCEILKTKIRKFVNSTDYAVKPDIPRYLGRVGNYETKVRNDDTRETASNAGQRPKQRSLWTLSTSTESLADTGARRNSSTSSFYE